MMIKANVVAHCTVELTWCLVIIRWPGSGVASIAQLAHLDIYAPLPYRHQLIGYRKHDISKHAALLIAPQTTSTYVAVSPNLT
jgi:hypothetical protein